MFDKSSASRTVSKPSSWQAVSKLTSLQVSQSVSMLACKQVKSQQGKQSVACKRDTTRYKRDITRYKTVNTRCKRDNTRCKRDNTRFKMDNVRCKKDSARFKMVNARCKWVNARFQTYIWGTLWYTIHLGYSGVQRWPCLTRVTSASTKRNEQSAWDDSTKAITTILVWGTLYPICTPLGYIGVHFSFGILWCTEAVMLDKRSASQLVS